MTIGTDLISKERERQITKEGWDRNHDDNEHSDGDLALAAVCYATPVKLFRVSERSQSIVFEDPFPEWDKQWDKRFSYGKRRVNPGNSTPDPSTYLNEERLDLLVKAGALIAAEIDLFISRHPVIARRYSKRLKERLK